MRRGDEHAVMAQQIAEFNTGEQDEEKRSEQLIESYASQSLIGIHLNTEKGIRYTKKWMQMYDDRDDKDEIEIAFARTYYGIALMRLSKEAEALDAWKRACDEISESEEIRLVFPHPWIHRALVHAFNGQVDLAETIILPVLGTRPSDLGEAMKAYDG